MVLYTICYDLNSSSVEQNKQVQYWLSYLNSILCNAKPIPATHAAAKWRILLVGTRSDIASSPTPCIDIASYRKAFPVLPIYHSLFAISTLKDKEQSHFGELCETIQSECRRILDTHSKQVPCTHKDLLELLQSSPHHIIKENEIPKLHKRWGKDKNTLEASLDHLHSIGEIVRFTEGRVCTKPSIISQILAKFIAPEDHVQESHTTFKKTNVPGILKTDVREIAPKYIYCYF